MGEGERTGPVGPLSVEELRPMWDAYRGRKAVTCPRDGGAVAVAVDATAHAYRLTCVKCGSASPWFESSQAGIQVRTGTSSIPAPQTTSRKGD